VVLSYVGRRFLDEQNSAPIGGYTKADATLGYRVGQYEVRLRVGAAAGGLYYCRCVLRRGLKTPLTAVCNGGS
jgi:hypothetical protein